MKRTLCMMIAVCMLLTGFGCSKKVNPAKDYDNISRKGEMVIGITIYEPMNYYDDAGTLVGFDTEFAQAVCDQLGVKANFTVINWDTKEIELAAGNIDCIWNGLTVTEERKANMDFSSAYVNNKQVVVVRSSDAGLYTDAASLSSANLAAEVGSAGESAIADNESLSSASYVAVSKQTDALLEVKSGTADAAVLDYTLAMAMTGEGTDYADLMMIPDLVLVDEEYAVGFRVGSSMTEQVNAVIAQLKENGVLQAIAEKYDLGNSLVG